MLDVSYISYIRVVSSQGCLSDQGGNAGGMRVFSLRIPCRQSIRTFRLCELLIDHAIHFHRMVAGGSVYNCHNSVEYIHHMPTARRESINIGI